MLEDCGGGDLKAAGLSRNVVSTAVGMFLALDGGVEGIWMSKEPTDNDSGSTLAMGAQQVDAEVVVLESPPDRRRDVCA